MRKILRTNFKVVLDPFCMKQFKVSGSSRAVIDFDPEEFEEKLNEVYNPENLKEGYAPFCKHLFIENFTSAPVYYATITEENQSLLKSKYEARTKKELAVLKRYFQVSDVKLEKAAYLDIILYSKEQVQKENESMSNIDPNKEIDYDWGVVSIKAQDINYEIPMEPITAMRNALGKDQGGSGVTLNPVEYTKSVEFWDKHAIVK